MVERNFSLTVVLEERKDNGGKWTWLHQCLLMLFDSPINHAGYLQVFIKLADGKMIRMHREVRIPRTFKRFEQLFCNFLQGCDMPLVQTKDGHARLLQFVNKSIEQQWASSDGAHKTYRIANLAPKLKSPHHLAEEANDTSSKIFVYIEFGPVDFNILGEGKETEYEEKTIPELDVDGTYSISRYPLSPSLTCAKLATAFEKVLEVF